MPTKISVYKIYLIENHTFINLLGIEIKHI